MSEEKKEKSAIIDFGQNPFVFSQEGDVGHLKLSGPMDQDLIKEYEKRMQAQLEGFASHLILDLSQCGPISPAWTRILMLLVKGIEAAHKRVRVVSTSDRHRTFFMEQGLESHFPIVTTVDAARAEIVQKKIYKLEVAFLNPFLEGMLEVLKNQCNTDAGFGNPSLKEAQAPLGSDIAGIIELKSDTFRGQLALVFPRDTYLEILSRMHKGDYNELTPDLHDGAAELANIVFGYAKRVLNQQGHSLKPALPSFILGPEAGFPYSPIGPRIAVPFDTDAGPFTVEICAGD